MFTLGLGALAMLKLELRRTLERALRRGLLSAEARVRRGFGGDLPAHGLA